MATLSLSVVVTPPFVRGSNDIDASALALHGGRSHLLVLQYFIAVGSSAVHNTEINMVYVTVMNTVIRSPQIGLHLSNVMSLLISL